MRQSLERLGQAVMLTAAVFAAGCRRSDEVHIITDGGFSAVAQPDGAKPGHWYHTIEECPELGGILVGQLGATWQILDRTSGAPLSSERFHEFSRTGDLLLGKLGAVSAVVSPETGQRLTEWYHEITMEGGTLFGSNGTVYAPVTFLPR